jgi:hypothetical protein
MNDVFAVITNQRYMGLAGMFLGVITALYNHIKYEKGYELRMSSIMFSGFVGSIVGSGVLGAVPVYAVSIPCYFVIKYLDKNKLI